MALLTDRLAVTAREAADMLGVTDRFIYSLVKSGTIRSTRIGAAIRIPIGEVHRLAGVASDALQGGGE